MVIVQDLGRALSVPHSPRPRKQLDYRLEATTRQASYILVHSTPYPTKLQTARAQLSRNYIVTRVRKLRDQAHLVLRKPILKDKNEIYGDFCRGYYLVGEIH